MFFSLASGSEALSFFFPWYKKMHYPHVLDTSQHTKLKVTFFTAFTRPRGEFLFPFFICFWSTKNSNLIFCSVQKIGWYGLYGTNLTTKIVYIVAYSEKHLYDAAITPMGALVL